MALSGIPISNNEYIGDLLNTINTSFLTLDERSTLAHTKINSLSSFVISGGGGGVSKIVAGSNIALSPITGTGIVTISALGSGGGIGGVSQIIAGPNITVTPPTGVGDVTISGSAGGLPSAPAGAPDGSTFVLSGGNWVVVTPESAALPEAGFAKFMAKQTPGNNSGCSFTDRAIQIWGRLDGNATNSKMKFNAIATNNVTGNPQQYLRVPFHHMYDAVTNTPSNVDYLDENPTVKIKEVIWNWCCGMALLSDNTVWVIGTNDANGLGLTPSTASVKTTHGFVKVNLPGYTPATKITKIQCRADNGDSQFKIFAVLDELGNFWRWGKTADGAFGEGVAADINTTPSLLETVSVTSDTQANRNFTSRIVDFEILGCEAAASNIAIIANLGTSVSDPAGDRALYIAGDNASYQIGKGTATTTSETKFCRAKKIVPDVNANRDAYDVYNSSLAPVNITDAAKIGRTLWTGKKNIYYIDSAGKAWSCGDNAYGQLGSTSAVAKYPYPMNSGNTSWKGRGHFCEVAVPVTANKIIDVVAVALDKPYALFLKEIDGVNNNLFACGYNTTAFNFCAVGTPIANVGVPLPCKKKTDPGSSSVGQLIQDAKQIFFSDTTGNSCTGYIDDKKFAWLAGYLTYNDPPLYSTTASIPYYTRVSLRNVEDMLLSGNVTDHFYSMFRTAAGIIWGIGDVGNGTNLFSGTTDKPRLPLRLL